MTAKKESTKPTGLALMRTQFPPHQIGKLPKGSKAQMSCPPAEKKNCGICGGWHHPKLVHLDFVGHAALTDRLLDADPNWQWEPMAFGEDGLPVFDADGGLWIKLTIEGVTRFGYGNAEKSQYKEVGSRQKECIGDALRNAAMRFGAALELWHKGELHQEEDNGEELAPPPVKKLSAASVKSIERVLKETGVLKADLLAVAAVERIEDIAENNVARSLSWIQRKADAMELQKQTDDAEITEAEQEATNANS